MSHANDSDVVKMRRKNKGVNVVVVVLKNMIPDHEWRKHLRAVTSPVGTCGFAHPMDFRGISLVAA